MELEELEEDVLSTSVDLDLVYKVAEKNPKNAIKMLCVYLKIKEKGGDS